MPNAIDAFCLGKKYAKFHPARPTTVVEMLAHGIRRFHPTEEYWALRDIDFSVPPGRMLGILGANGAGKSTLLRLLGGILQPDHGNLYIRGRIGALVDLGAGFHPDLTGRENIFLSGVIAGLTRREVAARFDEIVDFAELAKDIEDPLRTYSSGMQMRLAFAIASHIDPDILLIDEVLAVGDLAFQQKCLNRIQQFKMKGCTIVLVTHDPGLLERLCDEALWLQAGRIVAQGNATVVAGQYVAAMQQLINQQAEVAATSLAIPIEGLSELKENREGSQEMTINSVRILSQKGGTLEHMASGEALSIHIRYHAPTPIVAPIFCLILLRDDGFICYESNTQAAGLLIPTVCGEGEISLEIERLELAAGHYYFNVGVYEKEWRYSYDNHQPACPLTVHSSVVNKGVLQPPHHWRLIQAGAITSGERDSSYQRRIVSEENIRQIEINYVPAVTKE